MGKMNFLQQIFSVKNESTSKGKYKVFCFLGLKIKFKMNNDNFFYKNNVVYYSSKSEIKFLRKNFKGINNSDLKDKYINLIKNLDRKSVETVYKILGRTQEVLSQPHLDKEINLYTDPEQKEIKDLITDMKVVKLNENCYAYKNYLLPINQFEPSVFYYKHFIQEIENIEQYKTKDIIDAGAFIGDSALILSEITTGNVYSFEPVLKNYNLMNETIKLNKKTNIVPVNYGVGAKESTENICPQMACSNIQKSKNNNNLETIEIVPIDKYVQDNKIQVGLIKTDLEGFEQEFLKGAENTIKTQKPVLLISIYHNEDDFFNIKPIIESWNLGYKFKIVKQTNSIMTETLLIAEVY